MAALARAGRVEALCFRPVHHALEYAALHARLEQLRAAAPRAEVRLWLRSALRAEAPFTLLPADRLERLTWRRGRGAVAAGVHRFLARCTSHAPDTACVLLAPPPGWRRAGLAVAVTAPLDFSTALAHGAAAEAAGAAFLTALQAESPRWTAAAGVPAGPLPTAGRPSFLLHQARFHLGDALWLTPLLREIRRRFPGARTMVVAPFAAADLLADHRDLTTFIAYHPREGEARQRRVLKALGRRRCDVALFAFARRAESRWLVEAAAARGVPWRINLEYEDLTLDDRRPWGPLTHEGWLYWGTMASPRLLLHALDPLLPPAAPGEERFAGPVSVDLRRRPVHRHEARALLSTLGIGGGEPFAVLCPGGLSSRRWPAARFAELALRLAGDRGDRGGGVLRVLVEGGPDDAGLLAEIAARLGAGEARRRIAVRRDPLPLLAALLARAALLVGNDSAPIHIAEAVGTPTLYFAERQKLCHSHPRGAACWALYDDLANDPARITVEQALAAVREMARRGLLHPRR